MRRADQHAQLPIARGARRLRPLLPRIEAARRDRAARDNTRPTVNSAFSAAIQANLTPGASRRRPRLFLGCRAPSAARDSLCAAAPAPRARRSSGPVRPCVRSARARSTHSRSAVSVRSRSRAAAPTVLPSSRTRRTALALNSSVNWRRGRRFGVSAIGLDIVFPFGKMSTESDQAHQRQSQAKLHPL